MDVDGRSVHVPRHVARARQAVPLLVDLDERLLSEILRFDGVTRQEVQGAQHRFEVVGEDLLER